MTRNTTISVRSLVLIGFLLAFVIWYLYAHSATVAYGVAELLIAAICYIGCFKRYRMIDGNSLVLGCSVAVLAWCAGLFHNDFKSTLLITVPLLLPLYISTLRITYKDWTDYAPATIFAVVITYMAVNTEVFGDINSNTLGFLGFMGVSLGILWIKTARLKLIPVAVVLVGFYYAVNSGSRNVAIVGLICTALLFVPDGVLRKPVVYVSLCAIVLAYSVFATDVLEWIFSRPKLSQFLIDYTSQYSEKAWEMAGRTEFLKLLKKTIKDRDMLLQLFGVGVYTLHGHNMFYQCVLNFGYIGTMFIYGGFCRIFRLAYILITKNQDNIALGCVVILWGTFLLQGADVFVVGPESYAIVPQVIMGIILNRYGTYINETDGTNPIEPCVQSV